ncbi:MAG TPA: hypothetical protein PKY30_02390, partial [Myxococcota bacterium]|nr:hypothetical protein [Myxococcota bacterium]
GPSGAGKSTELWRLKRRLELAPDEVATVLRVDLERWLEPTVPVSVVEVQRVLVDALEQLSGVEQPFFGEWMRRLLRQHVQLREEDWSDPRGKLREDLRLRKLLTGGLERREGEFQAAVRTGGEQAVRRLRESGAGRVVLLLDGLDHIRPRREEDREKLESSVEKLLTEQAFRLHLPCHMVVTAPGWLGDRLPGLMRAWSGGVVILPVPMLGVPPDPVALRVMDGLVGVRLDRNRIFGEDRSQTLLPLLLASGGHPRDLLKLVRGSIERAGRRPPAALPVAPTLIHAAMDSLKAEYRLYARRSGLESLNLELQDRRFFRAVDVGMLLWHARGQSHFAPHPLGGLY